MSSLNKENFYEIDESDSKDEIEEVALVDFERRQMKQAMEESHRIFEEDIQELHMSSAYHPQTDGQSEVVNRCVEQYLRCFVSQQPRKWSSFLPRAEFWYNTTYHSSIGVTHFQALYGRPPPSIPNYQVGASSVNEVDQTLVSRNVILQQLKINLHAAFNQIKQVAD